ncbi:MAG: hypothetical protein QM662_10960 [Gordonia sp. (in: high G+C Gram-positive bacteria)]
MNFQHWAHIYHTRVRTSTVLLIAVFLVSWVLLGYTTQRYHHDEVQARPTPVATTTEPIETAEPTTESSESSESSTTTEESSTDESTDSTSTRTSTSSSRSRGLADLLPQLGGRQDDTSTETTTQVPDR